MKRSAAIHHFEDFMDDTQPQGHLSHVSEYKFHKVVVPPINGKHAVVVYKTIPGVPKRFYFSKEMNDVLVAREVAIQEGIRAFIPFNPEGRVVKDGSKYSAFSEYVPDFKSIRELIKQFGVVEITRRINAREYTGLGEVIVQAILTNEFDLHTQNLGIDKHGRFVKIDGDWACGRMRLKEDNVDESLGNFAITPDVISHLPFLCLDDRFVYNWFDQVEIGQVRSLSDKSFLGGINQEVIRPEINKALLKAILMPADIMYKIIMHQTIDPNESHTTYFEWMNARLQLFTSACANSEFIVYMKSKEAANELASFNEELNKFKLVGGDNLEDEDVLSYMLNDRFDQLTKLTGAELHSDEWVHLFQPFIDVDVKEENKMGETHLALAYEYGDVHLFNALVAKGGNTDYNDRKAGMIIMSAKNIQLKAACTQIVTDHLKALMTNAAAIYRYLEVDNKTRLFSKPAHTKDMDDLLVAISEMKNDQKNSVIKIRDVIKQVLDIEIYKPMTAMQKLKYGHKRDEKINPEMEYYYKTLEFVRKLNGEPGKHHYSRLLFIILTQANEAIDKLDQIMKPDLDDIGVMKYHHVEIPEIYKKFEKSKFSVDVADLLSDKSDKPLQKSM